MPAVLLTIGLLTTPVHTSGVSLNEYWAWVRYLHAIAGNDDLRLTRGFWDLDAHQKTILSDDFGMGIPMYWLLQRLPLFSVCDGRYFIERISASIGAVAPRSAKRGPQKSPDFVAIDAHGTWHVIECKGTQSGTAYRDKQIGTPGPPPTGAIAQKQTITFPASHTGQRLVCALTLVPQDNGECSVLKVVDPVSDGRVLVAESELPFAEDAATRAITAKCLRLAGFEATSLAISAPSGATPHSRSIHGRAEVRRRRVVERKAEQAREELRQRDTRTAFIAGGEHYTGRQAVYDLPLPVIIGEHETRRIRIRQGVLTRSLQELSRRPLIEELLIESDTPWRETLGHIKLESSQQEANIRIGQFFFSEIDTMV